MKNNMHAAGSRVIVHIPKKFNESATGIITPDANEKPDRGIIVALGYEISDPALVEGKLAIFNEYGGKMYQKGGETYVLLNRSEIYHTEDVPSES